MREIVVDKVIAYNSVHVANPQHDLDVVINTVSPDLVARGLNALKPSGVLVFCIGLTNSEKVEKFCFMRRDF